MNNTIIEDGINDNDIIYTIYGNGEIHCSLNLFGDIYFSIFRDKTKEFIQSITVKQLNPIE